MAVSGKPLPAGVFGLDGAPDPVLPAGAHHQGSEPSSERLRTRKRPPGLTKRADRKELDQAKWEHKQVKTENAHLNAQVSSMAQELSRKSEEIRKYHAEQAVVFQRIRELIGQPVEAVTKGRVYNHIIESGDPIDARKTIPILKKYSQLMKGLFEDV